MHGELARERWSYRRGEILLETETDKEREALLKGRGGERGRERVCARETVRE